MQAIYSAHLKLHPLLVLTVLVVAEHSLGVWGLPECIMCSILAEAQISYWVLRCMPEVYVSVGTETECVMDAVPLTVFTLDYLVRYPACSVTDVAAKVRVAHNTLLDSVNSFIIHRVGRVVLEAPGSMQGAARGNPSDTAARMLDNNLSTRDPAPFWCTAQQRLQGCTLNHALL